MGTDFQAGPTTPDEDTIVHEWRLRQFRLLGFAERDAFALARRPDVDLECVRSLIGKGCPPEVAVRIVL